MAKRILGGHWHGNHASLCDRVPDDRSLPSVGRHHWGGFCSRRCVPSGTGSPGFLAPSLFLRRPARSAFANDAIYLAIQGVLFSVLFYMHRSSMPSLILAWGLAAYVAAGLGAIQAGVMPRPGETLSWIRAHRDIGPAFSADYIANRGAEQLALVVISWLGGLATLGVVSACRSLLAPLTTMQSGINAFAMPELSRSYQGGEVKKLKIRAFLFGLVMAFGMLCSAFLLSLVRPEIGFDLLKSNWTLAMTVLLPMTIFSAINAFGYGLWIGLRAMQLGRETVLVRGVGGAIMVVATAAGVAWGGGEGAVWGLSVGASLLAGGLAFTICRHPVDRSPVSGRRGFSRPIRSSP